MDILAEFLLTCKNSMETLRQLCLLKYLLLFQDAHQQRKEYQVQLSKDELVTCQSSSFCANCTKPLSVISHR